MRNKNLNTQTFLAGVRSRIINSMLIQGIFLSLEFFGRVPKNIIEPAKYARRSKCVCSQH